MSESLRKRVLTAVVLAAALLVILLWLPPAATVVVLTALLLAGAWEWSAFLRALDGRTAARLCGAGGACCCRSPGASRRTGTAAT